MKTYSSQSGYVYQYYYEGRRERAVSDSGVEFVFTISADRKNWNAASVHVGQAVLAPWEQAHGRELSSTEQYAIAKMALFQAFDAGARPSDIASDIDVRAADVEGIIETLGL